MIMICMYFRVPKCQSANNRKPYRICDQPDYLNAMIELLS